MLVRRLIRALDPPLENFPRQVGVRSKLTVPVRDVLLPKAVCMTQHERSCTQSSERRGSKAAGSTRRLSCRGRGGGRGRAQFEPYGTTAQAIALYPPGAGQLADDLQP